MNFKLFVAPFIALMISLTLFSCGENIDIEDKEPPKTPKFTPKNADTSSIQTGIRAVSEGDYIFLEWEKNSEDDLKGYILKKLHPDSAEGKFIDIPDLIKDNFYLDQAGDLIDENGKRKTCIYYLSAIDESGNISETSFPTDFILLPKVQVTKFENQADSLVIECSYPSDFDSIFLIFRFIQDNKTIKIIEGNGMLQNNSSRFAFNKAAIGAIGNNLSVVVDAVYKNSNSSISRIASKSNTKTLMP